VVTVRGSPGNQFGVVVRGCYAHCMSSPLTRRGVRAALAGVTLIASLSLASPASADTTNPLGLKSIAFESSRVDARGDWTVVALQWTVRRVRT
jgi:hypothetical protein